MSAQPEFQAQAPAAYRDFGEHLADELRSLDLLIQRQAQSLLARTQPFQRLASDRHVFIASEEVDWLLGEGRLPAPKPREADSLLRRHAHLQAEIHARLAASLGQGVALPLVQLARVFGLSPFEVQTLLICLAPELDRKYDRLYAYLQDDITRKQPSIDLALTLLCEDEAGRWQARASFSAHSPLFQAGLLEMFDDPQSPSGSSDLGKMLRLDSRILQYLLGHPQIDGRLSGVASLHRPGAGSPPEWLAADAKAQLTPLLQRHVTSPAGPPRRVAVHCHGPRGVGKFELALDACAQLGCPLLRLDLDLLPLRESEAGELLRLGLREGLLLQAAVYLSPLDVLLGDEPRAKFLLKILSKLMAEYGWLVFLGGEKPWQAAEWSGRLVFQSIALPLPGVPVRETAWRQVLAGMSGAEGWALPLARQFQLTPGQIQAAYQTAEAKAPLQAGRPALGLADLCAACRNQSNQKLGEMAVKIEPRCGFEDIVLPKDTLSQLEEICSHARQAHRVFGEWGFDRKLSHGKGLSALFTGPPGTGKTLAAEVIARELAIDLYKVDLSAVVSKYIGETEKNLSAIFKEAETGNAILFFDEADALFGKRTEVADAHDRYANIETSYLLQKVEEYEGVVILASNLRENMDEAFTRRLRFIVEFPFPDEASRALIWKSHFPAKAPVVEDLDFALLARKFQIAGGNIKNIVLNAAFYAAENGGGIGMEQLLKAARREFEKMGKSWNDLHLSISKSGKN